jgi:proteic killer suppression protein
MIKSFKHKGLPKFFETGSAAGIQTTHATRLRLQLAALNAAKDPDDLKTPPGWRLHLLQGDMKNHHALVVNANWRLTFKFVEEDVELLDYVDYH